MSLTSYRAAPPRAKKDALREKRVLLFLKSIRAANLTPDAENTSKKANGGFNQVKPPFVTT
jgi:hypothetical protein